MGWFESQIEERRRYDDEQLEEALQELASAVTGRHAPSGASAAAQAQDALSAVLAYYGAKVGEAPRNIESVKALIDHQLQSTGIMCRAVALKGPWYEDAMGAMLGFTAEGAPVALLPRARGGYAYRDPTTGHEVHLCARTAAGVAEQAWCFYRPLPQRKLGIRDLALFMLRSLDTSDFVVVLVATGVATLLGMVVPQVNQIVFGPVLEAGTAAIVGPVAALLVGVMFSQTLLGGIKQLILARVSTKLNLPLQAALMMRVLNLPAPFFRRYPAGDLASRITSVQQVATVLQSVALTSILNSFFSLAYVAQIAAITPELAVPALAIVGLTTAISVMAGLIKTHETRLELELSSKLSGWEFALVQGIQKIRLTGSESRAFSTWAKLYGKSARLEYNPPELLSLAGAMQTAVSLAGSIVLYANAISSGVSVAEYMAFTSAFGMVSGAFSELVSAATQIAELGPLVEQSKPILETVPETSSAKPAVEHLSGAFELSGVSFSYGEGMAPVLDGLNLKVRPGEYVAVVGKTGCGKSTLLRLLLGFECPQRGAVYYDGRDLAHVDAASVRRRIGVVLQDGKLFQGSIYDNIAIAAPNITLDEAWEAAELAGIADDIRAMPMGMQTMVSEGQGGVSGGQRQRIMIARAIAARPRILMFDEATSALDNVTQRIVSDSLETLKCTRLVIAHRLSTVRHCDRIVVLDGGRIAEEGSYEELMEKGGLFAELAARQQV